MLQKLKSGADLEKGQMLVVDTGSQLMVGVCTGIKLYPGDHVWFGLNPNNAGVSEAYSQAREYFGEGLLLMIGGGFLAFTKQQAIYQILREELIIN